MSVNFEWYKALTPQKQLTIKRLAFFLILLPLIYLLFSSNKDEQVTKDEPEDKTYSLTGGKKNLEYSIEHSVNNRLEDQEEKINKKLDDALDKIVQHQDDVLNRRLQEELATMNGSIAQINSQYYDLVSLMSQMMEKPGGRTELPDGSSTNDQPDTDSDYRFNNSAEDGLSTTRIGGGITKIIAKKTEAPSEKKNQLGRSVFLPPSFMEATLLMGIDAPTMGIGKNDPQPVVLRVKAPAVLPNEVKANLKGCFVIANTYGNLAKERVELRLVRLSCLLKNGEAVVHQDIMGFVVDSDGKRDVAGHVVAPKAEKMLKTSFFVGLLNGLGQVGTLSNSSISVSPAGVTQTYDPQQALLSGLGKGLESSTNQINDYLMELIRQSSPVIEVGSAKQLTVVITSGVDLKIMETGVHHDES